MVGNWSVSLHDMYLISLQVLEHASVCLTRIAEAFASAPDKLDELCNHGLVTQAATLVSTSNPGGGQASLSTPTYTVIYLYFYVISFLTSCIFHTSH